MNQALSIWLDLSRVVAALAVYVGHSRYFGLAPKEIGAAWHRSADDAVTAFFVISGLVIAHTAATRTRNGRDFALDRMSRIYSVAVPAMLAAFALDLIGMRLDPTLYDVHYQYPRPWLHMPFHWLFLGETWFGSSYPFSMAPYWSLAYEAWYYVWFGCLAFLGGRTRWVAAGAVLLLMGPRLWLLLPTWWLGVMLYRRLDEIRLTARWGRLLMALAAAGYAAFLASGSRTTTDAASLQFYAWVSTMLPVPFDKGASTHVFSDYVVAALFATFVVGCSRCGFDFGPRTSRVIRALAGYTFTFYLIHFTLLVLAKALGVGVTGWFGYAALSAAVCAATWALAQVGEHRRRWYRSAMSRLWPV